MHSESRSWISISFWIAQSCRAFQLGSPRREDMDSIRCLPRVLVWSMACTGGCSRGQLRHGSAYDGDPAVPRRSASWPQPVAKSGSRSTGDEDVEDGSDRRRPHDRAAGGRRTRSGISAWRSTAPARGRSGTGPIGETHRQGLPAPAAHDPQEPLPIRIHRQNLSTRAGTI